MSQEATVQDVWDMVAAQRRDLAAMLEGLGPEDWAVASTCAGWSTKDVLAHLVWLAELTRPRMVVETTVAAVRTRCSPLAAMVPIARSVASGASTESLVDRLRAGAGGRFVVPGAPPAAALAEVLVHGLDITRPLGRPDVVPPDRARLAVLAIRRFAPVYGTGRDVARLRLTSTSDWSVPGSGGAELVASDGDLLLVAAGRLDPAAVGSG
jgi:uncharacterized protein (TIGR03083 family)